MHIKGHTQDERCHIVYLKVGASVCMPVNYMKVFKYITEGITWCNRSTQEDMSISLWPTERMSVNYMLWQQFESRTNSTRIVLHITHTRFSRHLIDFRPYSYRQLAVRIVVSAIAFFGLVDDVMGAYLAVFRLFTHLITNSTRWQTQIVTPV